MSSHHKIRAGYHSPWQALLCAVALMAPPTAPAADSDTETNCAKGNLRWSADEGVEYRRDQVLLRNVTIYECGSPLRIEAQRAEASTLDFDNSTWTLTGSVQVRLIQGQLAADTAVVLFSDGRLNTATVNGTPASFEQKSALTETNPDNNAILPGGVAGSARGRAQTIVYKMAAGEVQFVGAAWLSNGCNEINGPSFTYNLAQKSVKTPPQKAAGGGRVQGTIRPQCKPGASATATAPATPTP